MMMTTYLRAIAAGAILAAAAPVAAQPQAPHDDRVFVTVGVGAQPPRRNFETTASFPLFGEIATVNARQHVGNGPMVDVNGGYRIWNRVSVGAGVSSFRKSGGGLVEATVPDRLVFNRPRLLNAEVSDLAHTERAVYLQAMWAMPVTRAMEVAVMAGPSFMQVSQQLVTTATIAAATPTVSPVVETQRKMAVGINAGVEVSYLVATRFNPIVFARYNGGTVNLPSVSDLKVGGLQTGIGGRFRF